MVSFYQIPQTDFDVLVVGAGPGGAAAATLLCRAGFRTGLIDVQAFPRDKVCGDFLGPIAILELNRLSANLLQKCQPRNLITEAAVFLEGKKVIEQEIPHVEDLPDHGCVVPRMQLDQEILNVCLEAGVTFLPGHRLTNYTTDAEKVSIEVTNGHEKRLLTSRLLIGADGSNSTVARILTGHKYPKESKIIAVRAYFEGIDGPAERADLYFTEKGFPGYYWLFPTGPTSANIGVGMVLETLPRHTTHLKDLLRELIASDPELRKRIGAGQMKDNIMGWPLATYDPRTPIHADRLMLVGDAAGLINSVNGEGIQYALLSGRWAAETAIAALHANDLSKAGLDAYPKAVRQKLEYDMVLSRVVVNLIKNRKITPFWLRMFRVIVARSTYDRRYAGAAAGILAGIVPANKVINPEFLGKTAFQTGFAFALSGSREFMKGPHAWRDLGTRFSAFCKDLGGDVARDPEAYYKWLSEVSRDVYRLSQHYVSDLVRPTPQVYARASSEPTVTIAAAPNN